MSGIKHTCSLGSLCHSFQNLKRNNYKLSSYPFDWIFSNCDNIIHCIEDEFNTFLDKSYYIHISDSQCGHSKYHNFMFNHHNPLIHIGHYNYYVRCIDRFKNLLQNQEHKLFTMIIVNIDNVDDIQSYHMNNIIDFNNKFSKYTSNYTLLVIFHIPNKQQNHHAFTYIDNIHFLELHTLSSSGGIEFANNNDNVYLDNIMKTNYPVSITNE